MRDEFIDQWVAPFYLFILHGNYASTIVNDAQRQQFNTAVQTSLETATPQIASRLIAGHWREAIVGSWFAGLMRFTECQQQIGQRLLKSETCYAGQSHAFSMACFADDLAVSYLSQYLDAYLRRPECDYDQDWAMGALMWIDEVQCAANSARFLEAGGLWERFTKNRVQHSELWLPEKCHAKIQKLVSYCRSNFARP